MSTDIDGRRPVQPGAAMPRTTRILIVAAVVGFGVLHVIAGEIVHAAAAPVAHAVASIDGD
jgi:hypothetical protein